MTTNALLARMIVNMAVVDIHRRYGLCDTVRDRGRPLVVEGAHQGDVRSLQGVEETIA